MADNRIEDYLEDSVLRFNLGNAAIKLLSFKKKDTFRDYFGRIHAKNYYEIHYVTGGKGTLLTDNKRFTLKTGSLYVIGPEQLYHSFSDKGRLEEYCVAMQIENADSELARLLSSGHIIICEDASECEICLKSAERELTERGRFYTESVTNHFKDLLIHLARHNEDRSEAEELPKAAKDDKYCIIIDSEFVYDLRGLTLKRLSGILGLSERQCQRFLMNNYGMSYSEKLLQARMIRAADQLAFTDMDIQDIVEAVGYSESSYFARIFKKYYGITPREYRKEYRDD